MIFISQKQKIRKTILLYLLLLKTYFKNWNYLSMNQYKKLFLFFFILTMICCGKNKESEEHELDQKNEPSFEENIAKD